MVREYEAGRTPNPDVMCNKEIKFGLFYKKALEMGADYVATGHYVRRVISHSSLVIRNAKTQLPITNYQLLVARDAQKDQSYFLWTLKPEQLKHCLFPVGDYKKPQVRKLAEKFGLHNAAKKDSQGICFLGQVSLPDFLAKYVKPKKGPIVIAPALRSFSEGGSETKKSYRIIGTHNGAHFYTIGQRHLGIKNQELGIKNKPNQKPFYVAAKNVKDNTITVVEGDDHPALYQTEINLSQVNFLNKELRIKNNEKIPVMARVRYRQPLVPALFIIHNSQFMIQFKKPVKFVAPGQSAVFYDKKGVMLGGGIIIR